MRVALAIFAFACSTARAQLMVFEAFPGQQSAPPIGMQLANQTILQFLAPGVPASFPNQGYPIDILGNGRPDVLACNGTRAGYDPRARFPCRVFRPQVDGSIVEVTTEVFGNGPLPSLESPQKIHVADFNGDGRPDIYVAGTGYDGPPFAGEVGLLLLSNGDGTYADRSSTLPQRPAYSHGSCVGDLNGDGRPDIFLSNYPSSGATEKSPYIMLGGPNGTFTYSTAGIPPVLLANPAEVYATCRIADVDGDGYADLVMGASNGPGNGSIFFNDGTGNFAVRPRTVIPLGPHGENRLVLDVQAVDFNRDGLLDVIVVSTKGSADAGCALQVLVNQGGGSFRDETESRMPGSFRASGTSCTNLRSVDFNGDGWPDFYFDFSIEPGVQRFWISRGDGTWVPTGHGPLSAPLSQWVVHTDFDGDGIPDILYLGSDGAGLVRYRSFRNATPRSTVAAANRTDLWWNAAEPGWGVNLSHQGDIIFATLYTYDTNGQPLWLFMSNGNKQQDGSFSGPVYRATGPAFNASPWGAFTPTQVGTMRVAFGSDTAGTLTYSVNGTNVSKNITRYMFSSATTCRSTTLDRANATNYQDLWWNRNESGWGVNLAHQGNILFATTYTYDASGQGLWLSMSNGALVAPRTYEGTLYRSTGPAFNATPWGNYQVQPVGTMRIAFSDGKTATMTYTLSGVQVTKAIERFVFASPPPLCSSL